MSLNRREYMDLIFLIYKENRESKGWKDIYECHDEEDRKYFMELDNLYGR